MATIEELYQRAMDAERDSERFVVTPAEFEVMKDYQAEKDRLDAIHNPRRFIPSPELGGTLGPSLAGIPIYVE